MNDHSVNVRQIFFISYPQVILNQFYQLQRLTRFHCCRLIRSIGIFSSFSQNEELKNWK